MRFKIPIVSVFFEGDLRLQTLQALSIDRLLGAAQISEYILVLNGRDNIKLKNDFMDMISCSISQALLDKISFVEWNTIFPHSNPIGHLSQQMLKLGIARHINEPYYLLLDAKNHFVRPTRIEQFFIDGKPITAE